MNRFAVLAVLMTGCVSSSSIVCSDGEICPSSLMCDSIHHGCITQSQLDQCNGMTDGTTCTPPDTDSGVCDMGVCIQATCGDGYRTTGEACDGTMFGTIKNCTQLGFYDDVPLACTNKCELDQSVCTGFCGDGKVNGQELCDGALPTKTCVDFGYGAGLLQCSTNCGAALQECVPFGWKRIDMPDIVQFLHAVAADNVWVTGDNAMVQHYDGTAWSAVDVSSCATGSISQVFAVSATDAVLVTTEGVAIVTAAGCTKYPTAEQINVLWASSITDVYFGADSGLWHLVSGAWQQVDALPTQTIWGSGPNDIYAESDSNTGDTSVQAVMRHYDGTWSSAAAVTGIQKILQISGTSSTDVYLAGYDASGVAVVMHGAGSTWTDILGPVPALGSSAWAASVAVAADRVYVLALDLSTFSLLMVSGKGDGWVNMAIPLDTDSRPWGTAGGSVWAAASNTKHVYVLDGAALVETPSAPVRAGTLVVQHEDAAFALKGVPFGNTDLWTWDGATWTDEQASTFVVQIVGGEVYANFLGYIQKRNGPGDWTVVVASFNAGLIAGTSGTDLWYGTASTLRHWDGTNSSNFAMPFSVFGVWAASPTNAFAVGDMGDIAHWDGTAWTQVTSPTATVLTHVWGLSASDVYAAGSDGITSVFLHYDGSTWSLFPVQPPESAISNIWGTGPNDLFIGGNEGLHRWDGTHWLPVDFGSQYSLRAMSGLDDTLYISADDKVTQIVRTRAW